jgi:hypothetical protein
MNLSPHSHKAPAAVNAIGDAMEAEMSAIIVDAGPTNALFVDSCSHHTGGWGLLTAPDGHTNQQGRCRCRCHAAN